MVGIEAWILCGEFGRETGEYYRVAMREAWSTEEKAEEDATAVLYGGVIAFVAVFWLCGACVRMSQSDYLSRLVCSSPRFVRPVSRFSANGERNTQSSGQGVGAVRCGWFEKGK